MCQGKQDIKKTIHIISTQHAHLRHTKPKSNRRKTVVWKSQEQFILDGFSSHKEGFPFMKQPNIVTLYLLAFKSLKHVIIALFL